jgi:hypothetical protein
MMILVIKKAPSDKKKLLVIKKAPSDKKSS